MAFNIYIYIIVRTMVCTGGRPVTNYIQWYCTSAILL